MAAVVMARREAVVMAAARWVLLESIASDHDIDNNQ